MRECRFDPDRRYQPNKPHQLMGLVSYGYSSIFNSWRAIEPGARFVERILTLVGTTRRRGVDLLRWLTEAIQAELDGVPPPALA